MVILDYSDFTRYFTGCSVFYGCSLDDDSLPSDRYMCPFCVVPAPVVYGSKEEILYTRRTTEALSCSRCGWWQVEHDDESGPDETPDSVETELIRGILRRFDSASVHLPLSALMKHIHLHPAIIREIHPRKMEELVQAVFSDYFHCEVRHVGRTGDGGVDLIMVTAGKPAAIQVKRRLSADSVEPVALVREFLGATLLGSYDSAYLVTTADHFSGPAHEAACLATTKRLVNRFELIDFRSFVDMFNLARAPKRDYWRTHV